MSHPGQESPQDLAAAYALGALTSEEARGFEAFLAGSVEAQREVAEYREVAALLALAGPEGRLEPGLRDRVLQRVRAGEARSVTPAGGVPRSRSTTTLWLALAAALLAAVGLSTGLLSLRGRVAGLERTLAAREQALDQRQRELEAREATLNAILEPGVQLFQLTATGDPEPGIQLFWDRDRNQAIIHGFRLKAVPAGHAYQLWFIRDGKPVPSVTFKPEPTGHAKVERVEVPATGDISAAAVTIEPESGSPQPTSPILLVGALKKS